MLPGIEILKPNHAGALLLNNGQVINYGVICLTSTELIYCTSKGFQALWKCVLDKTFNETTEELKQTLLTSNTDFHHSFYELGYVECRFLTEIKRVIF